ncbi:unnamed protein product [marine sediment metagenome]|uniref:ABC transmembrane type-1 domain-containing protein n=1 Tax=marine sediment metagenome TaxID=412755 RepID=X1CK45_9ZZZZ
MEEKIFSRVATGYIEIVRGTPLLAQTLLLFYLPTSLGVQITGWELEFDFILLGKDLTLTLFNHAILIGIITLGLNSAA